MVYSENMTDGEIVRLLASNERAILEAHRQANTLAIENQQLRKELNRRTMCKEIFKGFPVGRVIAIAATRRA